MDRANYIEQIKSDSVTELFLKLYGKNNIESQRDRYIKAILSFKTLFPKHKDFKLFSAPGRCEIGGNHTDHQCGRVVAAAVDLDIIAVVGFHNEGVVRIMSEGHAATKIFLNDITQNPSDNGTTAIVKGIIYKFLQSGVNIEGFDMYATSNVICGGGISSSAAFETLIGTIINEQYNNGKSTPLDIAQYGWYAENVFYGKSCGLLDQTVCSYGGLVYIDFENNQPTLKKIEFDFEKHGYAICITDTKSSHENLTDDYVAIRSEMATVANYFGCKVLSEVDEGEFYSKLPELRGVCSDRAILRAMHFFGETRRAYDEAKALENGDIGLFLKLVNQSGISSGNLLQNLYSSSTPTEQAIPLALALSKSVLKDSGAVRVHGGGFAGTIQAFVPTDLVAGYKSAIERVFGSGACVQIKIRPFGGIEII